MGYVELCICSFVELRIFLALFPFKLYNPVFDSCERVKSP